VSLQEIVDEFEKALRESLERNIYDDPIPNKPTPKKPKGAA
jgi:hypothetical protein